MATDSRTPIIGIIGGSGLYEIDGLEDTSWKKVESSFGEPSDELFFGKLAGVQLVFLPRHGRGHRIPPSEINYRANIDSMKRAGVTDIISLSACGSFKEELAPGCFVIIDQFIDRTFARVKSFFGTGLVGHVAFGDPVCPTLGDCLEEAAKELDLQVTRYGTYLCMEGPQFSTKAESNLYRSWGCDVIGMTNMPEAKLAREAEIAYATVAMVTDYDCWHDGHDHVTVDQVIKVLLGNAEKARSLVKQAAPKLAKLTEPRAPHRALDNAIMTAPEKRDPELVRKLDAVAGRVL